MNRKTLTKLETDIILILKAYSGLVVGYDRDIPNEINGNYKVIDAYGNVLEHFDIKVLIPDRYPYGFPVLIETSEKIPRLIDRHINEKGVACVEFIHNKILKAKAGITLMEFFKNYVNKYFCWQLLFEVEGNKNLQEWPHDKMAIYIFYSELLKLKSIDQIKMILQAVLKGQRPSLNSACICASGKKFKRCHVQTFIIVLSLGRNRLSADFTFLDEISSKHY